MDRRRRLKRFRSFASRSRAPTELLEPLERGVRARLTVDARALAALRVTLGLTILVDLIHRAGALELFYTDAGVYPLEAYEATYTQYTGLSIHAMSGDLWFQQLLFVVAGLFAAAFVLGYRTRLVGAVSLLLLFSLHARNPAVLNGGDRLLRVLLFVALLTPLGERWSIDAVRRGPGRTTLLEPATVALLVQPVAVFTTNAILKHRGDTWYAGEALQIAFANDEMTVYLGNYLGAYPSLLTLLNWGWVVLLAGSGVFLLLSTGRLRALIALVYVGAFAGMLVTLDVGLFPLVLSASVIPYLTTPFWEAAPRLLPSWLTDRRPAPTASRLGSLGRPPVERRLLATVRERGHGGIASFAVGYGRALIDVVGALVLVWIVFFSAAYLGYADVPDRVDNPHLDQQRWGLYAPNPSTTYSWYVVEAELDDGSSVDAFREGPVNEDRPPDAARAYGTFRNRKFMSAVRRSGSGDSNGVIAVSYAEWACDRADEVHDGRAETVTLWRYVQPSPVDGYYEEPNRYAVIEHDC